MAGAQQPAEWARHWSYAELPGLDLLRARYIRHTFPRHSHEGWAFAQLGQFVEYKARRAAVPVLFVDPAYTSRTCAECGHTDKLNRVSQGRFACRSCGFVDHADRNGSRNVRARALELWRSGAESRAPGPA